MDTSLRHFYSVLELANSFIKLKERDDHILGNFNLETFVDEYISQAIELSKQKLPLNKFENKLRKRVKSKLKIDVDVIKYLSHPFHWEFFLNENRCMVLDYIPIISKNRKKTQKQKMAYHVCPLEKLDNVNIGQFHNEMLEKYGLLFKSRLYNLYNQD
ncbi:MAG: hypothetical protein AABX03_00390 [Nanoarchaeota archaeon]